MRSALVSFAVVLGFLVPTSVVSAQTPPEPSPSPVPSPSPGPESPPASEPPPVLPVYGASGSSKVFNPDIAVIGNFTGALGKNDVDPRPVLDLEEAEVALQAVVDPYARADFFLAFSPEGAEVEEGFLTFPALPGGFLMKVGKLKAQFGKANTMHAHQLPWVERPLVNVNLLGGEEGLADAGISLSRLLPNPVLFLEITGEVYQGNSGVFFAPRRKDVALGGRLRAYRDVGESSNWEAGTSLAWGHNDSALPLGEDPIGPRFTTRLVGVDLTFRWRPLRRAIYHRFLARTELVWSRREQPGGEVSAFGGYVSAEYQFARRWFAGARADWSERADDARLRDTGGSLLLTYWPSEFSQVRGQLRRIEYAEGLTANELLFQFLFSIGAHGAHAF